MPKSSCKVTKNLIIWYLENKRDLPWRNTRDPYRIWLSEIILQQTRVDQGMPYYQRFVEQYPTIFDLAAANETEVLKLWQGLGYYSRARNLHATAKEIVAIYKGIFPDTYEQLLKLKGIGDYTASAIASICFDQSNAVVDGNVYRVLSRLYGIDTPINATNGIKQFKQLAQELIDVQQPGTFNQAIMEFGARHCTPANPKCESCPLRDDCVGLKLELIDALPVKLKKNKITTRYFNYLVPIGPSGETYMKQRTDKGIWQNLYEFPLVESTERIKTSQLKKIPLYKELDDELDIENLYAYNDEPIVHKLSHQHLHVNFLVAECNRLPLEKLSVPEIHEKPVPVIIGNFISEFKPFQL